MVEGRPLPSIDTNGATLRHRRVWVSRSIASADVGPGLDPSAVAQLLDWIRCGRPLVGRSRLADEPADRVAVGLALPPRTRLALCLPAALIDRIAAPLELSEALGVLPERMRDAARLLAGEANARSMPLHVYGSVFWQQASGDVYLHAESDLDLLARPQSAAAARDWLDVIRNIDSMAAVRIDGEIEMPSGSAVAWRELAGDSDRLLVKSDAGPSLWPRERVWASWSAEGEAP